jgi:hypothetical protein
VSDLPGLSVLAVSNAYMRAALRYSDDPYGWPLDLSGYMLYHLAPVISAQMEADCADFLLAHEAVCVMLGLNDTDVGVGFWLARNDLPAFPRLPDAERWALTQRCQTFPRCRLWVEQRELHYETLS